MKKNYSFVAFGFLEGDSLEKRADFDLKPTEARVFIEHVLQEECNEISKEEFERAEAEYFDRDANLIKSRRESADYHKRHGIDVVTKPQRDIMDRVSRSLKKTKET